MHGGLALKIKPRVQFVGRKRKPGPRYPGGQMVQDKTDPKVVAFTMPHRQSVPAELRHDPKAETNLGRYQLRTSITVHEYEAGRWYAGVVNRYRRVLESPNPSPRSSAGLGGGRGELAIDDDEAQRRKSIYDNAFAAVSEPGQRSAKAVARVAVHDEPCPPGLFMAMRLGLIALAVHRGMLTRAQGESLNAKIRRAR